MFIYEWNEPSCPADSVKARKGTPSIDANHGKWSADPADDTCGKGRCNFCSGSEAPASARDFNNCVIQVKWQINR